MLQNLYKFIISFKFYIFILLICNIKCIYAEDDEYFSSVAGLENLYKTEVQLLAEMQNYIYNLQQHIDMLQRY